MVRLYTFAETRAGYLALWRKAIVLADHHADALAQARKIADATHKPRFQNVEKLTGVPWFLVGCILYRESSTNLGTYLGNGQSLDHVTTVEPVGRGPWKTFEDGAVDALEHEGMTGIAPPDWTVDRMLYWAERFNGQGYFGHGNSPYVWAGTDQYSGGLFTSDHHYDPSAHDDRLGVAALLKALAELYPDIAAKLSIYPPAVTPPATPQETTMTTTTAPATVPSVQITDPIPQIIAILETAKTYLPMLAGFLPKPWGAVVQAAIPIVEEGLELVEAIKSKSGVDLFQTIGQHIQAIGQQVQTTASTAAQATTTPTAPTNGMPNS